MSKPIYRFEVAEKPAAGHSLKSKEIAVYSLTGFIEKRHRNGADGEAEPYWVYVERGGKETGIESEDSAAAVERILIHKAGGPPANQQQLNQFTRQLASGKSFDDLDPKTRAWWLNRY